MANESGKNHLDSVYDLDINLPPPGFPSRPPLGFSPRPRPPTPPTSSTPSSSRTLSQYEGLSGFEFRSSDYTLNDQINITSTPPPHAQLPQQEKKAQAKDLHQQQAEHDDFTKSLDTIFPQQPRLDQDFIFSDEATRINAIELAFARSRLSLHLPLNFHILINSEKVAELVDMSTKLLNNDPTLKPYQVSMLKLIQMLPSTCKTALQVKKVDEEMKEFLSSLQSKMQEASLLGEQCKNSKEIMSKLRAEIEANVEAVDELDREMSPKFWVHRNKLVSEGSKKLKELGEMRSSHMQLADNFARVSGEIRAAEATKQVLQAKKIFLKNDCLEILTKFAPLQLFKI